MRTEERLNELLEELRQRLTAHTGQRLVKANKRATGSLERHNRRVKRTLSLDVEKMKRQTRKRKRNEANRTREIHKKDMRFRKNKIHTRNRKSSDEG